MNSGLGEVSCKKSKAWFLEEFLSDMPGSDITPVVGSLLREQLPCSNWKQGWWNFFIQRSEPHGNQGSENPPIFQKGNTSTQVRSIFQQKSHLISMYSPWKWGPISQPIQPYGPTPLGTLNCWTEQLGSFFDISPAEKPGRWNHHWQKCSIWWLLAEPSVPWRQGGRCGEVPCEKNQLR